MNSMCNAASARGKFLHGNLNAPAGPKTMSHEHFYSSILFEVRAAGVQLLDILVTSAGTACSRNIYWYCWQKRILGLPLLYFPFTAL
jgi:hypothetical protein